MQEGAAFYPEQPQPNHDDQRITHDFDDPHGVAHRLGGGAEQHGGDAHDRDGREGLQYGGSEGQHDAALPSLVISYQIGRDHRLAMAGSGGVEYAVEKRDAEQSVGGAAIALGGADGAG